MMPLPVPSPENPANSTLAPAELDGEIARKVIMGSSLTPDIRAEIASHDSPFSSGHGYQERQSKDIRYVVRDGPLRTISSWKNPLIDEGLEAEESNAQGRGEIFDLYIVSTPEGSVSWLDTKLRNVDDDIGLSDSDLSDHNELPLGDSGTSTPILRRKRMNKPSRVCRRAEVYAMHINSPHLKDAIRSIVNYYPSQILTGKFIAIEVPFTVLWHCHRDLRNLLNETSINEDPEDACEERKSEDKEIATRNRHIKILLDYLEPRYRRMVKPAEERHQEGVSSYEGTLLLLKPGCDAYAKVGGVLGGFIISSVKEGLSKLRSLSTDEERVEYFWTVKAWNLNYSRGKFVRVSRSFKIDKFEGEKKITSLPIFPCRYFDSTDNFVTRKKLETRGKAYFELAQNVPHHFGYQGPAWGFETIWKKGPKKQYDGEIIIDPAAFKRYAYESTQPGRGNSPHRRRRPVVSSYSASYYSTSSGVESKGLNDGLRWVDYENIDPITVEALTQHHYFLIPRRIDGFALKQKAWMGFDIGGIKPLQWSPDATSAMSQLILPRRDIEIIKALSSKHAVGNNIRWGADFIPGKGEGQVFLLHGPPGTGKTYTAECVADYTRRPLICLTVADIGTDEVRMEANLSRWFTIAASWQAIILIDEADVFLERRQGANLQRNSLVSVFLRCMEYYPGMLFLTTNRIGQIDDAFLSRTSVALTYEPLSPNVQGQIWDGFLAKLERERADAIVTDRARTFLVEDEDMKSIPWNGREIRNALQTAFILAMNDSEQDFKKTGKRPSKIEVDKEHFSKVVQRRKTFIEYRDSIQRRNEEQRALGEGSRALPKHS